MSRFAVVTSALLLLAVSAPPGIAAQEGPCGAVSGCTYNGKPSCMVQGGFDSGSAFWDLPDACFEECLPPVHCPGPEFAQELGNMDLAVEQLASAITHALQRGNQQMLQGLLRSGRVTFSAERRAIQVYGCDAGVVVGHFHVPERRVPLVRMAQVQ